MKNYWLAKCKFVLLDLGIFEMLEHQTRQTRNPSTNELITLEAHETINFKAALKLQEDIQQESRKARELHGQLR